MKGMIKLNEALKIMESGERFSLSFVTLDVKRKTGGKIRSFDSAVQAKKPKPEKSNSVKTKSPKKNPNHWTNQTRPIKPVVDGIVSSQVRKVHIFLITEFNGKKVFL